MPNVTCTICRGEFPEAQIFTLEGRAVCAGCKPAVLARVLSGAPAPLEPVDLTRELGFWEMLGTAGAVFREEWPRMLPLVVGVSLLCSGVLSLFPRPDPETAAGAFRDVSQVMLIDLVLGIVATVGTVWLARERLEGRRATLAGALAQAGRRWLAAVGTGWLEGVILIVGFLLLIVPGVLFAGYYTFSTIIVALTGRSGMEALNHSKTLVTGRWWRVFGYSLALILPILGVGIVVGMASALWPDFTYPDWVENLAADLATLPAAVGLTVLYLHLEAGRAARTGSASVVEKRLGE